MKATQRSANWSLFLVMITISVFEAVASAEPTNEASPPTCGVQEAQSSVPDGYELLSYRCQTANDVRGLTLPGGTTWEAAVVGGIGSFVVDRAQQEVIQWFLDTMLSELCENADGRTLFEHTCKLRDVTSLAVLPSRTAIVAAMRTDVEQLAVRLLEKIDTESGKEWGIVVLHLFRGFRASQPPLELIAGIAELPALKASKPCAEERRASCALVAASVVVQAYIEAGARRQADESQYIGEFVTRLGTKIADIGLQNIERATAERLFGQIKILADDLIALQSRIVVANTLHSEFAQREVIVAAFDLTNTVISAIETIAETLKASPPADQLEAFQLAASALAATVAGRYEDALTPAAELVALAAKKKNFPRAISRYLPLMIDLAQATSGAEVRTALEAAAEPVGGWRLKRTGFMASLSALAGANVGWEISINDSGSMRQHSLVASAFAPVGFDLSWPVGNDRWTWGLFVSVLDVGNVVGARVMGYKDDDVAKVDAAPVVGFPQVFSPGLYVRVGLGRTPFVIAGGASWSPQLRRLQLDDDTTEEINALRLHLGVAADITLFPF